MNHVINRQYFPGTRQSPAMRRQPDKLHARQAIPTTGNVSLPLASPKHYCSCFNITPPSHAGKRQPMRPRHAKPPQAQATLKTGAVPSRAFTRRQTAANASAPCKATSGTGHTQDGSRSINALPLSLAFSQSRQTSVQAPWPTDTFPPRKSQKRAVLCGRGANRPQCSKTGTWHAFMLAHALLCRRAGRTQLPAEAAAH